MEDYYIRLYFLELKEVHQEESPMGFDTEKYFVGFSTNYSGEFAPQISSRFTAAAFWMSFEDADYVNIHLDKKFFVNEHHIPRTIKSEPQVATKWKKRAKRDRNNRALIRAKQKFVLFIADIWDRATGKGPLRIVERTRPDGKIRYVIQRKNLLFWDDCHSYSTAEFVTLKEAQHNLCWYDGTKNKDRAI